uniref:ABC transporter domain-containing protein n=1 Tax=Oryza brachyantha TaxID=4533 RepID=J3N6F5_ORYBR
MPPNGQDSHGGRAGLVALPPPPSPPPASNKMDCFLSSVCTPLDLQFIDLSFRVKLERAAAAAAKGAPPGRISHAGGGGGQEERTVLKGITGEARPGEVLAVLGPSGSGKSTLLSILGGRLAGQYAGTRKRVSIGHEMLVNPSLLVLDEPTSGLDSTAAARLVATLSSLARKGRTVVMSVHQPSTRVYRMFDSVLLLAEGSCLYFGAGRDAMDYFASVGFSPAFHVNPADFMLDLANGFAQAEYESCNAADGGNVKQSLMASYSRVLAPRVKASIDAGDHADAGGEQQQQAAESCSGCTSWANQFTILLRRSLKERRHETFTSLRLFQIIAPALERPVLARERASGMYALSSYFMSRMAGDLPMELALPTAFTVIVYLMAGLNPSPAAFALTLAVILSYVLVAEGLGLAVGAVMMDAKRASTLVTVVMLAYLLTGGFYVHNVPGFMAWAKYTSFTYYCYRLLIAVQYSGRLVAALVAMFFAYRLLAYLALRRVRT